MAVQTFLGGLVVIRRHQQTGVGAAFHGATGEVDGLASGIGAGAGDHRHPAAHKLDDLADDLAMLFFIESGGFAGGAHGDDGVGALLDVELDEPRQTVGVETLVCLHGGDQGHHATVKHREGSP